jgi:hypothetical protein
MVQENKKRIHLNLTDLNRLYEDYKNTEKPILLILDYVNSKFAGMDQKELDLRLEDLRKIVGLNSKR